jgi:(hydroxyamino)benzene mutase
MTGDNMAEHLLFHGTLLFLLGLINGAVIPLFLNKRMGLSAHLAGVQNGLALIAFGLIWPHADVPFAGIAYWSALASMYGIWFGLLLAAIWGTSRSTPIGGKGFAATSWKENLVTVIIQSTSVAAILATSLLLAGLYKNLDSIL